MTTSDKKRLLGKPDPQQQEPPAALHTRLLRLLLSHVGMFILVAFVAALGAWIFMLLERPYEDKIFTLKRGEVLSLKESEQFVIKYCWHLGGQNVSYKTFARKVGGLLVNLQEHTLSMAQNYGYDGTDTNSTSSSWDFTNTLLFTVSIMTTIGYGHIAPKTTAGQMFTIMYAMIGTPLLLVFLANIGDGMAKVFSFTYSRLCCRWCRSTRYQQERRPGKRAKRVSEDEVGKEEYMPSSQLNVPITINLVVIALYLGLGAAIFSGWEEWEFSSAYYFSFVTLSTIGFGDMVPGNSFIDKTETSGFTRAIKMGITIAYCLIGMALISMCIQVMQVQVIDKVNWAGQELGVVGDRTKPRLQLRRTRRGAAPETRYAPVSFGSSSAGQQRQQRRKEVAQRREQQQEEQREQQQQQQQEKQQEQQKQNTREQPEQREQEQQEQREQQKQEQQEMQREQQQQKQQEQPEEQQESQTPQLSDSDEDMFNLA